MTRQEQIKAYLVNNPLEEAIVLIDMFITDVVREAESDMYTSAFDEGYDAGRDME